MELLAEGAWQGAGVLSAESFDPDPYLAILDRDGIHHAMIEIEPGQRRSLDGRTGVSVRGESANRSSVRSAC